MPVLRLTNTLTRRKEVFAPIDPTNVRLYACGPTVYDDAHIGNARPIIVFDLLFRLLRHLYGAANVTYARNLTDVDDKINARAAERGISIRALTDGTIARFHEDIRALGVLMPEDVNLPGETPRLIEPRATDHIDDMTTLIERLVAEGHAYVAEGHVLFSVPSMPDYGSLSRRPLDEMEAGARIDVAPYKRSPLDFVLWKPSPLGVPGWSSPCGIAAPGRPGWHIECSAMSWRHLGETFDIHAGGIDLVFPHHENELAQSRCCFGTAVMANVWLHNGFLQVEGQKMSKSAGNFVTIREVLKDWPGEVVRLSMLKTHYRQPIDWTVRGLQESERSLERWWRACWDATPSDCPPDPVVAAVADDLDFHGVETIMHRLRADGDAADLHASLRWLGFAAQNYRSSVVSGERDISAASSHLSEFGEEVSDLLTLRATARAAKNWAESDRIRDELAAMGVALKDNKDGTTTWEIASHRDAMR